MCGCVYFCEMFICAKMQCNSTSLCFIAHEFNFSFVTRRLCYFFPRQFHSLALMAKCQQVNICKISCGSFTPEMSLLPLRLYFQNTTRGTYGALYAAGRLSEQLRLGVLHLGGVEDLLALHLVQVQEAAEPHGGWKERGDTEILKRHGSSLLLSLQFPAAFIQCSFFGGKCRFRVSDELCVRVRLTRGG